jgi:hypothetical protein
MFLAAIFTLMAGLSTLIPSHPANAATAQTAQTAQTASESQTSRAPSGRVVIVGVPGLMWPRPCGG